MPSARVGSVVDFIEARAASITSLTAAVFTATPMLSPSKTSLTAAVSTATPMLSPAGIFFLFFAEQAFLVKI